MALCAGSHCQEASSPGPWHLARSQQSALTNTRLCTALSFQLFPEGVPRRGVTGAKGVRLSWPAGSQEAFTGNIHRTCLPTSPPRLSFIIFIYFVLFLCHPSLPPVTWHQAKLAKHRITLQEERFSVTDII